MSPLPMDARVRFKTISPRRKIRLVFVNNKVIESTPFVKKGDIFVKENNPRAKKTRKKHFRRR